MTEIHSFLLNAGYQPQTKVGDRVYSAISKAFDLMGESCSDLLLSHLGTVYGIPRHIVLTRFDLVSRAIGQVFGYGSEVFLHEIRENILKSLPGAPADYAMSTAEIIKNAYKAEALQSVRNFAGSEQAVLVFSGFSGKEEVTNSFYQYPLNARLAVTGSGCNSRSNARYDSDGDGPQVAPPGAHLDFPPCPHPGEGGNKGAHLDSPYLCAYGVKQAIDNFQRAVLPHSHVITDEPFLVYARPVLREFRQEQQRNGNRWAEGHHA